MNHCPFQPDRTNWAAALADGFDSRRHCPMVAHRKGRVVLCHGRKADGTFLHLCEACPVYKACVGIRHDAHGRPYTAFREDSE